MSEESTTDTYTVSFKTSGGYDASLIVVRGDTPQELGDNITALHDDIVSLVVDTELLVHTAYSVKATPNAGTPAPAAAPAAAAPAQSSGVVMTCAHGKRTERSGSSKKGPWTGYFCPQPKGSADQCAVVWAD